MGDSPGLKLRRRIDVADSPGLKARRHIKCLKPRRHPLKLVSIW
jgi:hypothetical protein